LQVLLSLLNIVHVYLSLHHLQITAHNTELCLKIILMKIIIFYLRLEEVVDCLFDFELIEHSSHFLITYFKSGFNLAAD